MIGTDFCIVSGFVNGIKQCTPEVYCLDTQKLQKNPNTAWVQKDSLTSTLSITGRDLSLGISHGAFVVVGSKFFMCGGVRCCAASFATTILSRFGI